MRAQGGSCVGDRDGAERIQLEIAGGAHQQFQVHHVVDDDGILPAFAAFPAFDGAHPRVEPSGQFQGSVPQNGSGGDSGNLRGVPETGIQLEADVVVGGRLNQSVQFMGVAVGPGGHVRIVRTGERVPEHARPETAAPPVLFAFPEAAVRVQGTGKLRGSQLVVQVGVLDAGQLENPFRQVFHAFGRCRWNGKDQQYRCNKACLHAYFVWSNVKLSQGSWASFPLSSTSFTWVMSGNSRRSTMPSSALR